MMTVICASKNQAPGPGLPERILQQILKLSPAEKDELFRRLQASTAQQKSDSKTDVSGLQKPKSRLDEMAKEYSHSLYVLDALIRHQRVRHRTQKMLEVTKRMMDSVG